MSDQTYPCELCGTPLVFVRDVTMKETEHELRGTASGFSMPVASSIYECPNDHARFRIFISGAVHRLKT